MALIPHLPISMYTHMFCINCNVEQSIICTEYFCSSYLCFMNRLAQMNDANTQSFGFHIHIIFQ